MADDRPDLLRPRPVRPFSLGSHSSETSLPSSPSTPMKDPNDSSKWEEKDDRSKILTGTRSVLNLTSSTLYGIYDSFTPSGNGSQTPLPRSSIDDHRPPVIGAFDHDKTPIRASSSSGPQILALSIRTFLLFLTGILYGVVISQLHDSQRIAPIQLESIERWSWGYLLGWGGVGVVLGALLPWADVFWEEVLGSEKDVFPSHQRSASGEATSKEDDDNASKATQAPRPRGFEISWYPVVRSITAFVGVAFAIRRLPWASTLQVSITLALVNPVLWYLFDRSKPGFLLSTLVGVAGTFVALGINPDIVPSPATASPRANMADMPYEHANPLEGIVSVERMGVGTWIASVLFCSSLCFGNVGRRLGLASSKM